MPSYLSHRGEKALRVKGGIFRGCFAVRLKLLASEIAGHRRTRRELRIIAIRIATGAWVSAPKFLWFSLGGFATVGKPKILIGLSLNASHEIQ